MNKHLSCLAASCLSLPLLGLAANLLLVDTATPMTEVESIEWLHSISTAYITLPVEYQQLRQYELTGEPEQIHPGEIRRGMHLVREDVLGIVPDDLSAILASLPAVNPGREIVRPRDTRLAIRIDGHSGEVKLQPAFGEAHSQGSGFLQVRETSWPEEMGRLRSQVPPKERWFYVRDLQADGSLRIDQGKLGLGLALLQHDGKLHFGPHGAPGQELDQDRAAVLQIGRDAMGHLWLWFEESR